MRNFTINVTQEHINAGVARDCKVCPIALAAMDSIPELHTALVGRATIDFRLPYGQWMIGDLPETAQIFIRRFDASLTVEPFTFTVDMEDYPELTEK